MVRAFLVAIAAAGCGDNQVPEGLDDLTSGLTMFFRMEESGDGPRKDGINDIGVFPWKKLDVGTYHQDGIGTTLVPAVVGNGQHIAGANGYHFASAGYPVMNHDRGSFTWVGWASVDPADAAAPYTDHQTLLAKWTGIPDTDVPPDRREYRVWFESGLERWRFEVSSDGLEGDGHSVVVTHPAAIERGRMYFIEAWHDAEAELVSMRISDQTARGVVESVVWDAGVFDSNADLDVGAQNSCADDHLQGTLDALGFWKRSLSETESAALWNGGHGTEF